MENHQTTRRSLARGRRDDGAATLLALGLEPGQGVRRQIQAQIREAVLAGRVPPGGRVPSSRALAGLLGCARASVVEAYEQLIAEGYLEGRSGAGTFVAERLPDALLTPAPAKAAAIRAGEAARLSRRGAALAEVRPNSVSGGGDLDSGSPDVSRFPFEVWGRLLGRVWRRPAPALVRTRDPAGDPGLRRAILRYLRAVRGVVAEPEQLLITAGAQQALDLAARVLLDPSEAAWIEEPGYPGLRGPLSAAGARLVPVPLDAEGLSLAAGRELEPAARLAVVTPSHQYPLGITMSLARRLALLEWAGEADAWVLEDDYDSEYRYAGRPLAALQGLDRAGRVLYLGSFSKVLFPALRVGYLIVPPALAEPVARARRALDDHPGIVVQPALAAFMDEGHFASHVRRMRLVYESRRRALLEGVAAEAPDLLEPPGDAAGLHVTVRFKGAATGLDDRRVAAEARAEGLSLSPLSSYYLGPGEPGLLLGFATTPEARIAPAVARLARLLRRS